MVDLCEGPHVPNTAVLKAMDVLHMSRAYWRGDQSRESLYRIYGITFPDSKQLKVSMESKKGVGAISLFVRSLSLGFWYFFVNFFLDSRI